MTAKEVEVKCRAHLSRYDRDSHTTTIEEVIITQVLTTMIENFSPIALKATLEVAVNRTRTTFATSDGSLRVTISTQITLTS